jgi:hypothetical protein
VQSEHEKPKQQGSGKEVEVERSGATDSRTNHILHVVYTKSLSEIVEDPRTVFFKLEVSRKVFPE